MRWVKYYHVKRIILKRQVGKIGYYIRFYFYSSDFISVLGSYYFRSLINE